MTVKELFLRADFKWIAIQQANDDNQMRRKKFQSFDEELKAKAEFAKRIYLAYLDMMKIEPEESNGEIVWCSQVIEDDGLWQDVRMSYQSEIIEKEIFELHLMDRKQASLSMDEYEERYITQYAFEFEPWEKVLGYEVANASLEIYGTNVVASIIFDEMTFLGLEYQGRDEEVQEQTAVLEERCAEVSSYMDRVQNSSETQDLQNQDDQAKFITAEEALKQMREKFGIPESTREEMNERRKRWNQEAEINNAEAVKILKRMKQEYAMAHVKKLLNSGKNLEKS